MSVIPSNNDVPSRRRAGCAWIEPAFTLIELLVVVAILALLIAMLVPGLAASRANAKRAVSASNLRQIGLALAEYANDHRGRMPETTHGLPPMRSWIHTLRPYLSDVDEVRLCPADPHARERLANGGTSYVMNEYVAVPLYDAFGRPVEDFTNLHRLRAPARTITTFVGADDLALNVSADHTHSRLWFHPPPNVPWNAIRADIQPDRYRAGPASSDNSRGSTNLLYADAHVAAAQAADLKRRAERGIDFSQPPERGVASP
jgi:prepilin-type N-terminal cleavage/methylation domain-containing protein/prepilin-type processing-associated H-X9-DG protein